MPIIKSAIKRMKQNEKRRKNNRHYGSHMKSMIKLLLTHVEKGEMDKAKNILPEVISSIDTAAKKKLIHENNAAHKKSRVQKAFTAGPPKKEDKPAKKAKAEKLEKAPKKEEKAEMEVEEKVEADKEVVEKEEESKTDV